MNADARRMAFFQEMDRLRGQAKRPAPPEIVALALKSGLTRQEALGELRNFGQFAFMAASPESETLPTFIAALHRRTKANRVLEYVSSTSVLTAYIPEKTAAQ